VQNYHVGIALYRNESGSVVPANRALCRFGSVNNCLSDHRAVRAAGPAIQDTNTVVGAAPVQQSVKVYLTVNLNTAQAFGLRVPATLLGTADEVIE
jgi:hypothetical protein